MWSGYFWYPRPVGMATGKELASGGAVEIVSMLGMCGGPVGLRERSLFWKNKQILERLRHKHTQAHVHTPNTNTQAHVYTHVLKHTHTHTHI